MLYFGFKEFPRKVGMRRFVAGLIFVVLGLLSSGSTVWANGMEPVQKEIPQPDASFIRQGQALFLHYCAHCHGIRGEGDGFNADFLDKEPADLSDTDFISKKTNGQIFRVIQRGGAGVKKSQFMPVFGHTLSEKEVWSLVAYVRKLAGDNSHPVIVPDGVNSHRPQGPPVSREEVETFSHWFASWGNKASSREKGEYLFKKKRSCLACHQVFGEGGRVGPDLSRAGLRYKPEWLNAWIKNPQAIRPDTKMPNMGLSPEEIRAIVSFLKGLHEEKEGVPEKWAVYIEKVGDPERGKKLFFDPEGKANCAKCHSINGEGGDVGPDLSYTGSSRTFPFLMQSILDPKAVITAGFTTVLILTKDGKFLTGIKTNEDEAHLDIVDKEGKTLHIPKERIKKFKVQKISMMPGNYKKILTEQEVADLIAFLETLTHPAMFSGRKSVSP